MQKKIFNIFLKHLTYESLILVLNVGITWFLLKTGMIYQSILYFKIFMEIK